MGNVLFTQEVSVEEAVQDITRIATTPYVREYAPDRKKALVDLLISREGAGNIKILRFTQSLCPGCVEEEKWDKMKIDSLVFVQFDRVWQLKQCAEHGVVKSLYYADYGIYKKAEAFQDPGIKILNPHIDKSQFEIDCPNDCGLCVEHESHTGLGNVVLTNRCDLTCWYCFFYAKEGEPIYEPTMDQIKFMLKRMKNVKPIGANAVQLTGGEPTLRDDLCDIIRAAKEIGYDHVQLNTNAIRLSREPQLAQNIREAGVNNLYMSFDGMTPQTNPKNYWEAQAAIENCRKAGIGVVLVPTVIGGINDHELGDIIRFGMGHLGVVRSVNFQPVSLVGRMPDKLRMEQRITIPGAIKRIEAQTDNQIGKEAWFPVPCARQITDFIEALKEEPKYRLSIHFACGSATYVFKGDHGEMVPITNFFDIEGFFNYLGELTQEIEGARVRKLAKAAVMAKLALNIRKYIDNSRKPKNLNLIKMLTGAMAGGNYHGLADLHYNSLFVGMMHFQDPYNWDLDRIHKCDIHYATPDGKVIPFCTFNVIPELYRDNIQRKFSVPAAEWEAKTGKKIADVYHRRVLTDDQKKIIIGYYNNFRRDPHAPKPKIEPDWGFEAIKAAAQAIVAPAAPAANLVSIEQITGSTKSGAAKRPTMSHPAGAAGCGTSGGC